MKSSTATPVAVNRSIRPPAPKFEEDRAQPHLALKHLVRHADHASALLSLMSHVQRAAGAWARIERMGSTFDPLVAQYFRRMMIEAGVHLDRLAHSDKSEMEAASDVCIDVIAPRGGDERADAKSRYFMEGGK